MHKRSSWKLPYVFPIFFDNKFFKSKVSNSFRLFNRSSIISKRLLMLSCKISIYSGKTWKSFFPREIMLGLKLGEFCFTKVFGRYISLSTSLKAKMKKQDKKKK